MFETWSLNLDFKRKKFVEMINSNALLIYIKKKPHWNKLSSKGFIVHKSASAGIPISSFSVNNITEKLRPVLPLKQFKNWVNPHSYMFSKNKNNSTWCIIVVKSNFFVSFLEELNTHIRHFEINRPLVFVLQLINLITGFMAA